MKINKLLNKKNMKISYISNKIKSLFKFRDFEAIISEYRTETPEEIEVRKLSPAQEVINNEPQHLKPKVKKFHIGKSTPLQEMLFNDPQYSIIRTKYEDLKGLFNTLPPEEIFISGQRILKLWKIPMRTAQRRIAFFIKKGILKRIKPGVYQSLYATNYFGSEITRLGTNHISNMLKYDPQYAQVYYKHKHHDDLLNRLHFEVYMSRKEILELWKPTTARDTHRIIDMFIKHNFIERVKPGIYRRVHAEVQVPQAC